MRVLNPNEKWTPIFTARYEGKEMVNYGVCPLQRAGRDLGRPTVVKVLFN